MRSPIVYTIVRPIICTFFKLVYRPTYINKNFIPKKGRVILAGTHTNKKDGFLLGSATKRCVRFIVKDELFKVAAPFFKGMGMVPVNRRIKDKSVIPTTVKLLNEENIVGIFPEGTINKTDDLIMAFKPGVIKMALESQSPIIPFAISGSYEKFKPGVTIIFGEKYLPKTDDIAKEIKILEAKVRELKKSIGVKKT